MSVEHCTRPVHTSCEIQIYHGAKSWSTALDTILGTCSSFTAETRTAEEVLLNCNLVTNEIIRCSFYLYANASAKRQSVAESQQSVVNRLSLYTHKKHLSAGPTNSCAPNCNTQPLGCSE